MLTIIACNDTHLRGKVSVLRDFLLWGTTNHSILFLFFNDGFESCRTKHKIRIVIFSLNHISDIIRYIF